MLKKKLKCSNHLLRKLRRATTCSVPLEPPRAPLIGFPSTVDVDHRTLSLSLIVQLVQRGLIPSAQQVVRRIIIDSPSISNAASVLDFAVANGMEPDLGCYGALIRKLVEMGQLRLAESFYRDNIIGKGIKPDGSIFNSMAICSCNLGKLDDALGHLDTLLKSDYVPNKKACHSILGQLFAQERYLRAFDYFIRINRTNVNLGLWCYNRLIDGLCFKGCLDEAVEMFDILRERTGMSPPLSLYKSLYFALCKRGFVLEAEALIDEIEYDGYYVDKVMHTCLMKEYCRNKKMKMAMRVYLRMLKKGYELDDYIFNTLIHGFVKIGLFDKGWVMFNQMTEKGMQPNVITYHIMISNYCKEGKVDHGLMLLDNMMACNITPNVHCYTTLMAALSKNNKLAEAHDLYKKMLKSGVAPDHIMFFVLMKMMIPKGLELDLAHMTLQAIAENGCGIDITSLPDQSGDITNKMDLLLEEILLKDLNLANVGFTILITALCAVKNCGAALSLMDKMVGLGCRPLLFAYNSVINCLCQQCLFEDADRLVHLMQEHGVVPDQSTYLIMVKEYCKRDDTESAIKILYQMQEIGVNPTVSHYDSIISSFGRQRRIFEAQDMFKKMLESNIDPDEVCYMTMINAYAKSGKTVEALELFERMVENSIRPSSYSYTALISGLIKKGMIDKGCMYLYQMMGENLVPNVALYTSLIENFLSKGDSKYSFRLIDLLGRNNIQCDVIMYIQLLTGLCRNIAGRKRFLASSSESEMGKELLFRLLHTNAPVLLDNSVMPNIGVKTFALNVIESVKDASFMPNLYLYNGIISVFCVVGKINDAYHHLELMQKDGIHPNHVTYTILMNGHIKDGDFDSAVTLFNKINGNGCIPDEIMYNSLLRGLCNAGRAVSALSIAFMMQKRGFYPSKVSYVKLLHCLCAVKLTTSAFGIFKEMIDLDIWPRQFSCNWLLCNLCEQNKFDEVLVLLKIIDQSGNFSVEWRKNLMVRKFTKEGGIKLMV